MLQAIRQLIESGTLINSHDRLLLAVSGGVDSMVMLDLFHQIDIYIEAAHCNFHLRGEESDEDEDFVAAKCQDYGIPLSVQTFETDQYAREKGLSIQMAARELRYRWLFELLANRGLDRIITAHQKNDQFETSLFNFTKGTGIKGLIPFVQTQESKIIRPLIHFTKNEIREYAKQNKIEWREDSSNTKVDYQRNWIRQTIMPALEEVNPSLLNSYENTFQRLKESWKVQENYIRKFITENVNRANQAELRLSKIALANSLAPTQILYSLLDNKGFNYQQCREIWENLSAQSGKVFLSTSHEVLLDRQDLMISERNSRPGSWDIIIEESMKEVALPVGGVLTIEKSDKKDVDISSDPRIATLDGDLVKFPLHVRSYENGDWFFPLGMERRKKLSDFFIDQKIPLSEKDRIPIVLLGDDIVWVVGHRIDNRFKVTKGTNNLLRLKYEED